MKKKKQVIVTFKTKPMIFEIEPEEINCYLFGKQKKEKQKK